MYSLSFNGTDLESYGLVVNSKNIPFTQETQLVQFQERAYAGKSKAIARTISLPVSVTATSWTTLKSQLDTIFGILNLREDAELILSPDTGRYFLARLDSIDGKIMSPTLWQGQLSFICQKPFAYAVTPFDTTYPVNADPKTIILTVAGSANTDPVYTLTAGANLTGVTIKLKNTTTNFELCWTGNMLNTDTLEIDCEFWIVELEAVASMSTVTGKFPYLVPGINSIQVTAFGVLGSLRVQYRARYI